MMVQGVTDEFFTDEDRERIKEIRKESTVSVNTAKRMFEKEKLMMRAEKVNVKDPLELQQLIVDMVAFMRL